MESHLHQSRNMEIHNCRNPSSVAVFCLMLDLDFYETYGLERAIRAARLPCGRRIRIDPYMQEGTRRSPNTLFSVSVSAWDRRRMSREWSSLNSHVTSLYPPPYAKQRLFFRDLDCRPFGLDRRCSHASLKRQIFRRCAPIPYIFGASRRLLGPQVESRLDFF